MFSTAERHLAEWFVKGAARNTYWYTTLLQAFFVGHSNFRDFWVAPYVHCLSCLFYPELHFHNTFSQVKGRLV
jgi:hypothetical protein